MFNPLDKLQLTDEGVLAMNMRGAALYFQGPLDVVIINGINCVKSPWAKGIHCVIDEQSAKWFEPVEIFEFEDVLAEIV